MSTRPTTPPQLQDAFDELERRADAYEPVVANLVAQPRRVRLVAPLAAAACVAAGAGVLAWSPWASSSPNTPAAQHHRAGPSAVSSSGAADSSSAPLVWEPPQTQAALAAKTRAILGDTASVTYEREDNAASAPVRVTVTGHSAATQVVLPNATSPDPDNGSSIYGTMTGADGARGGYLLNVYKTDGTERAECSGDSQSCTRSTVADGTVSVGRWSDGSVAGGRSVEVNFDRKDGAMISLVLSTEADPKGMSSVTADHTPLSVTQAIAFVTSDQW